MVARNRKIYLLCLAGFLLLVRSSLTVGWAQSISSLNTPRGASAQQSTPSSIDSAYGTPPDALHWSQTSAQSQSMAALGAYFSAAMRKENTSGYIQSVSPPDKTIMSGSVRRFVGTRRLVKEALTRSDGALQNDTDAVTSTTQEIQQLNKQIISIVSGNKDEAELHSLQRRVDDLNIKLRNLKRERAYLKKARSHPETSNVYMGVMAFVVSAVVLFLYFKVRDENKAPRESPTLQQDVHLYHVMLTGAKEQDGHRKRWNDFIQF